MTESKDNACAIWDFRFSKLDYTHNDIIKQLAVVSKQFTFQLEEGDGGYLHYQGRMSLVKKRRAVEKHILLKLFETIKPQYLAVSANSSALKGDNFYVTKVDTRIEGPWTEKDLPKEVYIPRQYRDMMSKLYPYQRYIFDNAQVFDTRIINMIYCPRGNIGKSTIASICELYGTGIDLPPVNDSEKLIQSCCDICEAKGIRNPSPIFVDMPRAMNKERLNGIYTAIEQIKKGKLFDLRYKYKEYWIDSPQIWVFSNISPDLGMLSMDRWRLWSVNEKKELVPWNGIDEL